MPAFDSWICPLCNQPLSLLPYPKGRGFRLDCKGSDAIPHRLRIYLDGFRKNSPFLVAKVAGASPEESRSSRVKALLSRVRDLTGSKESEAETEAA
jgi:hypothetical protein